ncbi:MAG TPA: serine/threonine-protein kinase [Polyangiaceae bacterium]|nr:serine/threonine-protein kinase [Polyangiaceae bacterium]
MKPGNIKSQHPGASRIGELVASRFRVRRLVASGGMANVFEAEDLRTRRLGALKLLRDHCRLAPDAMERLAREASAATRISGPHVVQAIAAGRLDNGEPYLFMELLEGLSLRELLERRGRLPVREALDIVEQAARGLCAAHAVGVLHRDIKPANLFLSGHERHVKLLDFGVSKLSGQHALTREGLALGTFSYMPPEQMISAKRVDGRADLFSLGVVLYESIAGRLPYTASSVRTLMQRMEANDYPPLHQVCPDVSPEIDSVLACTLRADPEERFTNARALSEALLTLRERAAPQRTRSAPPPSAAPEPARPAAPGASGARGPMSVASPGARQPRVSLIETIVPETRRR